MALDNPDHGTALSARYADQERPDHILRNETIATQLAPAVAAAFPDRIN
ncbi:MAG TPA: hypothetical protein VGC10_03045 [Sphingomonas sp.]